MGLEGCNLTLHNVQLNVKAQIGIRVENDQRLKTFCAAQQTHSLT